MLIQTNSKANILVDGGGRARLTDFGNASVILGGVPLVCPNPTTLAAPEILGGTPVSKEGDIFTFAMVAVEVCARGTLDRSSRFLTLTPFGTDLHR